jgi:PAS domain S-box-containing protein
MIHFLSSVNVENLLSPSRHHNYKERILTKPTHAPPAAKEQMFASGTSVILPPNSRQELASNKLGVSNQQFRFLAKNLPIGVALLRVVYDAALTPVDFVTLEANPEFLRAMGINREKIVNRSLSELFPAMSQHPPDWTIVFARVAESGVPEKIEVRFPLDQNYYHIYVFSPKKGYCIVAFIDVSRQRLAEQERISAEKMYRRLYETTQDGIMARDLQGRMLDCNRAYARMLGYTKRELRKLSVKQLLPEKWQEQREKIAAQVVETGRSIVFEREYRRKDGSVFPASVRTWRLTDDKGRPIGMWSIVRDISEQKALQKDLEKHAGMLEQIIEARTKQLKDNERLATIGQTAGMVGHDLRNPLQTIIGELYLAKRDIDILPEGEVKCTLQESLQVIEEQAAYMDKIVSDLQAFVQPIKLDRKPVDLKELVSSVFDSVGIPCTVSVQTKIPKVFPDVIVDHQLLKRVLINLVTNAVQAMPQGGKLSLTAKLEPQGRILVEVKDTGVGISEETKKQLFTPLFTTKSRGQGFGLAVCKRVIEAHGGAITFESTEGKGAKFTIQFPAS